MPADKEGWIYGFWDSLVFFLGNDFVDHSVKNSISTGPIPPHSLLLFFIRNQIPSSVPTTKHENLFYNIQILFRV